MIRRAWLLVVLAAGCTHVTAKQRAHLDNPAMRSAPDPAADQQRETIFQTQEGATIPSAGSGATPGWVPH